MPKPSAGEAAVGVIAVQMPLLSVRDLTVEIGSDLGHFKAVDGLSFEIPRGKTVAEIL